MENIRDSLSTMRKARLFLWVIAIMAGLAAMAIQITARQERSAATLEIISSSKPRALPVDVMGVKPSDWEQWRSYYGEARASRTMEVATYAREAVEAVHVEVGDRVEAGQLLISLRREDQAAEAGAKNAAYDEAKSNHKRLQALNKAGGVSKAEVDRAYSAMKAEEASAKTQKSALVRTQLRSKISGVVTTRDVELGEIAEMGQVLLTIDDTSEMEAVLMVSIKDIKGIGKDTPVRIIHGGRSTTGKVVRTSQRATQGAGLYPVTVKLDPSAGALPGTHLEGSFLVSKTPDVIVIPSSAIINRGDGQFVYVASGAEGNMEARLKKISTGGGGGGRVVATSGLEPGDMLIVSGSRGLSDGTPVSFGPATDKNSQTEHSLD